MKSPSSVINSNDVELVTLSHPYVPCKVYKHILFFSVSLYLRESWRTNKV